MVTIMQKNVQDIVPRTWRDPSFRSALIANPRAVLTDEGVNLPAGVEVEVIEDTRDKVHLVLPPSPAAIAPEVNFGPADQPDGEQLSIIVTIVTVLTKC